MTQRSDVGEARLEPTAPRYRVKHSTTEPLRSLALLNSPQVSMTGKCHVQSRLIDQPTCMQIYMGVTRQMLSQCVNPQGN